MTQIVLPLVTGILGLFGCGTIPGQDVRYEPTPMPVVRALLELADVGPQDLVYDLGSGDGRIPITAAHEFGARGVGIEIDPALVTQAQAKAREAGVEDKVEFRLGDMYAADVRSASVVTLFLHPGPNLKLREKLRSELPAGSRVVSYVWDMGSWTPAEVRRINEHRMFLWRIPSRAGLITSPKLSQQLRHVDVEHDVRDAVSAARGQEPQPQARPTGLPGQLQWTFNFDAGWGTFGFQNSLFENPKEDVEENLSDQWFEGFIRPALSGSYTGDRGQFYGKASAVGERTYASVPDLVGPEVSSFGVEDLHAGWRSGPTLALGENVVDVTVGRAPYQLGRGFLLYDGSSEGGSRGGYWSNARRAFQFAAIGRFTPAPHRVELFYLDRDELEESDSGSRLWGANYEFSLSDQSTVGATYMKWFADAGLRPERDGLSVYDFRAFITPVATVPDLALEFEYAREDNGEALDSNAWYLQGAYQLSAVQWTPRISYRYAFFQGDDVDTAANEAFDPLFLGFYDWGTWWQGEIAGEYFLSNSNLTSHEYRVHVTPTASIGTGLIYFDFNLDQPASFAPGVTATAVATEIDWYMDWKINTNFTASFVAAWADPGTAVQQAFDRTEHFTYGMVYLGYAF